MNIRWLWIALPLLPFVWLAQREDSHSTAEAGISAPFALVDPEQAPPAIRSQVMKGFGILFETKKNLPEYAGDRISCTNCHFSGGNSMGGEQEGFSLVGVTSVYPKTLSDGSLYTLPERINSCFLKSTNGKALPVDSEAMKAIVTYLEWISHNVAGLSKQPWLGVKKLRSGHTPNAKNGARVFKAECALCHGDDGEGQVREDDLSYPPLWGAYSFNDAAGMNQLPTMASFIYYNMPYHEPKLSVEDAIDVAAYVISQPRPHYIESSTPASKETP